MLLLLSTEVWAANDDPGALKICPFRVSELVPGNPRTIRQEARYKLVIAPPKGKPSSGDALIKGKVRVARPSQHAACEQDGRSTVPCASRTLSGFALRANKRASMHSPCV